MRCPRRKVKAADERKHGESMGESEGTSKLGTVYSGTYDSKYELQERVMNETEITELEIIMTGKGRV